MPHSPLATYRKKFAGNVKALIKARFVVAEDGPKVVAKVQ